MHVSVRAQQRQLGVAACCGGGTLHGYLRGYDVKMRGWNCHSTTADGLVAVTGGFRSTFDVASGGKRVSVEAPSRACQQSSRRPQPLADLVVGLGFSELPLQGHFRLLLSFCLQCWTKGMDMSSSRTWIRNVHTSGPVTALSVCMTAACGSDPERSTLNRSAYGSQEQPGQDRSSILSFIRQ